MSPLKTHNLKTHTCAAYCYGTVKEHHLTKVAIKLRTKFKAFLTAAF